MATHTAIRAVSSSLRNLLLAELENGPIDVTVARPDADITPLSGSRINLFLYKVDENSSLKNMDLPGRGHPAAYGRPPLSIDLHYLVTAYGSNEEDDLETHELLGNAMRVLHDNAMILGAALDSTLENEIEHVKLYLEPLSLEEISKIWSAITRPIRASVSYLVTVVQIENQMPRRFARPVAEPPVGGPRVRAVTWRAPRIEQVMVIRHDDPTELERPVAYARVGDRLVLRGSGFSSDGLRVILGTVDATAGVVSIAPDRIEVTVPDDPDLQPGATPLMTQNDLMLGDPETPHQGFASNVAPFVLVPEITGLTLAANSLQIDGTRLVHDTLPSLTIVGDAIVNAADYTTSTPTQIEFDLPNLPAGDYLVRVRVNGAESFDEETVTIP